MHIYTAQLVDKVIDSGLTTSFYSKNLAVVRARQRATNVAASHSRNSKIVL